MNFKNDTDKNGTYLEDGMNRLEIFFFGGGHKLKRYFQMELSEKEGEALCSKL